MSYRNLLIGCGHARDKRLEPKLIIPGLTPFELQQLWRSNPKEWQGELTTLDYESPCNPDVVWDLNTVPWPFQTDTFDELHAYEVLEHLGRQGDYRAFFETFSEIWRVLKPGGYLCATVPSVKSMWAWGDPGHTRVIPPCALVFLTQEQYNVQQGHSSMSDYRRVYRADFEIIWAREYDDSHRFVLQAVKPSRCSV